MRHTMRLGFVTVAMLVLVAMVGACAPAPAPPPPPTQPPAQEQPPIKIGVLLDISGYAPEIIPFQRGGLELALDEVGWEVAGRKIEIIVEDTASDPLMSVDKARKVVEFDNVDVVMGPLYFPHSVAAYLSPLGIPHVQYCEETVDILSHNNIGKCIMKGTSGTTAYYTGLYAYDTLGYRTAVLFYPDFEHGQGLAEGFRQAFEQDRGGKIVQEIAYPLGTLDFAPYLASLKEADCVANWCNTGWTAWLRQYRGYGHKMPIVLLHQAVLYPDEMEEYGPEAAGIIVAATDWSYQPINEASKRFLESYESKYGVHPEFMAADAYTAMQIILEGAGATGGDMTPDKFLSAVFNSKIDTIEGTISWSDESRGYLGIGDVYILELAKIGDRYTWTPIETYSQIIRTKPADLELLKTYPK